MGSGPFSALAGRLHSLPALLAILLVAAVPLSAQSRVERSDFAYNTPVPRGELLTILYDGPTALSGLSVELRQSDGNVVQSTAGFRYRDHAGKFLWVVLLGVPSTAAAGSYTLAINAVGFLLNEDVTLAVDVADRSFAREVIPLDRRLTAIRTEPDPVKIEQARVYAELINNVTPNAIFSSGALQIPTASRRVTSLFGDRRVYRYSDGSEGYAIHHGIDYGAPTGTPIYAAAAGRVRMATDRITTGKTIVIEHLPGVMTVYFHLDDLQVAPDHIVSQGDLIGTVGATGLATGAHLHWELRAGGVAIDPAPYLARPLLDISR